MATLSSRFKHEKWIRRQLRAWRVDPQRIRTVRVRCCGKLHRVGVVERGPVIFYEHPRDEVRAMRALGKLDGCLKAVEHLCASTTHHDALRGIVSLYDWLRAERRRNQRVDTLAMMRAQFVVNRAKMERRRAQEAGER